MLSSVVGLQRAKVKTPLSNEDEGSDESSLVQHSFLILEMIRICNSFVYVRTSLSHANLLPAVPICHTIDDCPKSTRNVSSSS